MCSGSGVPAGFGVMEIRRHVIEIQQLGRDQEFGQDQQPGDLSKNFTNLAGSACQCRVQFDAGSRIERGSPFRAFRWPAETGEKAQLMRGSQVPRPQFYPPMSRARPGPEVSTGDLYTVLTVRHRRNCQIRVQISCSTLPR